MELQEISFENLPKAVAFILNELVEIKSLVKKEDIVAPTKRIPIDIVMVSALIGKAKSTIYALVRNRKIPCYKNGKKLYFFEDEILEWITAGKKKTIDEINSEASTYKRIKKQS